MSRTAKTSAIPSPTAGPQIAAVLQSNGLLQRLMHADLCMAAIDVSGRHSHADFVRIYDA